MSYTIKIDDGFILVSFERGTLFTFELIIDVLNLERNSPDRLTLNDIWDVRGADVDENLSSEAVELVVQHINEMHSGVFHKRTALVIDSKVALGMTRMFQILASELPYESQVFEDLQSAKDWVTGDTTT